MTVRSASPSFDDDSSQISKKHKLDNLTTFDSVPSSSSPASVFAPNLFSQSNVQALHSEHESSGPYKHAVVHKLFQDEFLNKARKEIVEELSFREKETDICKSCLPFQSLSMHHI